MSKQKILASLMAMAFFSTSFAGMAEAKMHHDGEHPRAACMEAYEDLTAEQKTAIKDLKKKLEADMNPIKVDIAKKEAELKAVMKNDNPDAAHASKLAGEIETLRQKAKGLAQAFQEKLSKDFGLPEMPAHRMMGKGDKEGRGQGRGDKEGRGPNNKS